MNKPITIRNLTNRQIATIIGALRYFQANLDDVLQLEMAHFDEINPLNSEEIDDLCESINFEE